MSLHIVEVGPTVIRQLCCGHDVFDDEIVRTALDSIDDPVTLLDRRPVAVDALWRTVLGLVACAGSERAIVVHPTWWAPTRLDVVGAAAQALATEVVLQPRSWLLTRGLCCGAVVVEIADCFVVITGAAVTAEARQGAPNQVIAAVAGSILAQMPDPTADVMIDAPSTVRGAGALASLIADELRCHDGISARHVDDAGVKNLAAQVIRSDESACEPSVSELQATGLRRQGRPVVLAVLLIAAAFGVLGMVLLTRHPAPVGNRLATTYLVEGHVAVEVPAQWPMRRIVEGPGSARVQVTSPSDPEVALHVTQSRVALASLGATADALKHAIDAEPTGAFVDFNPADTSVGRPAVTYREIRPNHDIRWIVFTDKEIRISIGCQSRHGHDDAVRPICELAVRSARAAT